MTPIDPWELGHSLAFPQPDEWSVAGMSHREYLTAHIAAAIVAGCQFDPEQVARRTAAIVDALLLHDRERQRAARRTAIAAAEQRPEGGGS